MLSTGLHFASESTEIAERIARAADILESLLQNSSNAANFDCVRGAERPTLRPVRA
jgi:hypothetical protein